VTFFAKSLFKIVAFSEALLARWSRTGEATTMDHGRCAGRCKVVVPRSRYPWLRSELTTNFQTATIEKVTITNFPVNKEHP